jgi:tetratricopeptide (TPR) repeat protein
MLESRIPLPETKHMKPGVFVVCLAGALLALASTDGDCQASRLQQSARSKADAISSQQDVGTLFIKGQAALQSGDLDTAEAAFRRVIALTPQSGGAYANLGVIAMRRKDWEYALKLLKKAQTLEPAVAGIRLNIGLVNYQRGDYAGAIAPLASVVRDQPDSQQARYLLGLSNLLAERYQNAFSTLEPLWPAMSDNFMYLYVLSMAASKAGHREAEQRALTQLIQIGADRPEFHLLLGKAYLNLRETEKAVSELERAANMTPNLPFVT